MDKLSQPHTQPDDGQGRLAETGRWRNSTRRWKPLSSLSDSYKTITFSFSSCYKNSYFFFLFCGSQPAGILSGGTMSGCGCNSRPWRNSSPNARPLAGSCRRSLDGETAKSVTTFWVHILLFSTDFVAFSLHPWQEWQTWVQVPSAAPTQNPECRVWRR